DNPKLLILDPLPAFLGSSDSSTPGHIRSLLHPLLSLAEYFGFAILGISHLNKSTHKKDYLQRSLGSQVYTALARSVLLVLRDPLNRNRRLMIPIKNSFDANKEALAFSITPNAT